jgi:hypothetical protein
MYSSYTNKQLTQQSRQRQSHKQNKKVSRT